MIRKKALWIDNRWNFSWVGAELAAMTQGQAKYSDGSRSHYASKSSVRRRDASEEYNRDVKLLCKKGRLKAALEMLDIMDQRGIQAYSHTYGCLLQGCINTKALTEGRHVHAHMIKNGYEHDLFLGSNLVRMYAKCRSVSDARKVFDKIPKHNLFLWNAMIAGYVELGHGKDALKLFREMQQKDLSPDKFTITSILKACANLTALEEGKGIHADIIKKGIDSDIFLEAALVNMYAKCGSIGDARRVFDTMTKRDIISWSAMISGYAHHGCVEETLKLFHQMQKEGMKADVVLWSVMIAGFVQHGHDDEAFELFKQMQQEGVKPDVVSWTTMISGYAQHGRGNDALKLFHQMQQEGVKANVVSWNAMIAGYAQHGRGDDAFDLFQQMRRNGVMPNVVSWNAVIAGYAQHGHVEEALRLFEQMQQEGVKANVVAWNTMIAGYAHCGLGEEALKLFRQMQQEGVKPDVVSWTAMIAGYAQHGHCEEARELFQRMQRENVKPDVASWNAMISGYAQHGHSEEAFELFWQMQQEGVKPNMVSWNAIIAGYAQHGRSEEALEFFDQMKQEGVKPDVVTWNAMITGYVQHGRAEDAIKLSLQMQREGKKPDNVTFTSILNACASLAALEHGKLVHADIIKTGCDLDISVGNALIDMYAKCGSIHDAHQVFQRMSTQDVVSWNSLIAGYAMHGQSREALLLFEQMGQEGLKPNHITFIGVLSACIHGGLLDEGRRYFELVSRDHTIRPTKEHYACMVDLLGHAGCLNEALDVIFKMPFQPDSVLWYILLGACRIHGNVGLAEHAAECAFKLEPKNAAPYVLLSNIYAATGRWGNLAKAIHIPHPEMEEISAKLESLVCQMEEAGFVPDTCFVPPDVGHQKEKEHSFHGHSERLAIAFGLISIPWETPVRVTKNLWVCGDCHNPIKCISKIAGRDIIVRDANCFHHFKEGVCNCGDYCLNKHQV